MKQFLLIFSYLTFSVFYAQTPQAPAGKKWVKVEELTDEFDGTTLDETKWQKEPIGNDWMWDGRPPALFKASNVVVEDGKLNVTVGKLNSPVISNGKTFTYQGGIVRSLKPGHVGWYFEAKMKANETVMSSTFWLMTKYNCEKKLELDIQECVGKTTDSTEIWGKEWDQIFHANAIHRKTNCHPESERVQDFSVPETKNYERFYVYGAWWKSESEILFYLDGVYAFTLNPTVTWDVPAFIQMAIETYDWNPVPANGGLVTHGTKAQRTTQYEWVRTWKLDLL